MCVCVCVCHRHVSWRRSAWPVGWGIMTWRCTTPTSTSSPSCPASLRWVWGVGSSSGCQRCPSRVLRQLCFKHRGSLSDTVEQRFGPGPHLDGCEALLLTDASHKMPLCVLRFGAKKQQNVPQRWFCSFYFWVFYTIKGKTNIRKAREPSGVSSSYSTHCIMTWKKVLNLLHFVVSRFSLCNVEDLSAEMIWTVCFH